MKLIIDIGNTSVNFALFEKKELLRKTTTKEKAKFSPYFFENFVIEFLADSKVEKVYLSSVVPNIRDYVLEGLKMALNDISVFEISPESKSNMIYDVDSPKEIGADIIADLAIGKEKYGYPLLIADLGTASKILFINKEGNFAGCNIIPGLTLSLKSLISNAALLPNMDFKATDKIVAKNTIDAMNSGVVFSHIGGIDYIFKSYEKELGYEMKKVITGGCAMKIKHLLKKEYIFDEDLLLEGINFLGDLKR